MWCGKAPAGAATGCTWQWNSYQEVVNVMTSFSLRRLVLACTVSAAAVVAVAAPGTASAASDLGEQCSGSSIKGHGSSFQAPILVKWAEEFSKSKNPLGCDGEQGSKGTPTVEYLHTGANSGSGACLHGWGAESTEAVKFGEFGFCGTDEAPNPTQKAEIESHASAGVKEKSLEEIPVLQGAVAVIVHLPKSCLATSEVEKSGVKSKLGRLVLDDTSIEGVYAGTIKTWKQLLENQTAEGGAGNDKLTCKEASREEQRITPVVRLDHSGTTHIFKSFLLQINTAPIEMEEYPEEVGGKATGCKKAFTEEAEKWSEVSEACQNQRWPKAAEVLRGTESGNPGVVKQVNQTESSIGYADLAVTRELHDFSAKCSVHPGECGGENTGGQQNTKFWVEVQDSETPEASGFSDPATNGDIEAPQNSRCNGTVYTNEAGKKFPPANTREPWNGAKAELVQTRYSICGLTYDLALRQYKYYPETTKEEATTVHDFLLWALNPKTEGGGALEANTDYEKLSSEITIKSKTGVEEIGFEKA
jgi:ABC-type phosphate transport system substrate-binding protein